MCYFLSYVLVKDSSAINVKILKQLAAGCLFRVLITSLESSSLLLLALQKEIFVSLFVAFALIMKTTGLITLIRSFKSALIIPSLKK